MKQGLVLVGGTAAVALLIFLILTVGGVDLREEGTAQESGGFTGDLLIWSGRQELAVCVEVAGSAKNEQQVVASEAVESVSPALLIVSQDEAFTASERLQTAASSVVVEAECPGDAQLDCPAYPYDPPILCPDGYEIVKEPSKYRVFVYVVSDADLEQILGGATQRRGGGEHLCSGDSCSEVTSAVYVSVNELNDTQVLAGILREGLGFGGHRE
ncbi:MAG: hypothetical protein WED85_08145 [Dehalococcoidia bacterium]